MTEERTGVGHEIETALEEVLAHVRSEVALPCRMMDAPTADRIVALRKRLELSRRKFADRFGLDVRALQEWEQGRRVPDRAARVLLTVIDHDPDSVVRALAAQVSDPRGDSRRRAVLELDPHGSTAVAIQACGSSRVDR